ncbi:GNAT family N-acetyltransferase [Paenibacillus psychroresistens]|uniref:GNAT family N-acetyltransferase n=1 Tax=Paenibacillus psychroresistens TaxID=1778678 RepID=A0A6B8REG6_9BACL|nr:GNAT family N-acetyltransferase [Paenibacillus psychroresistens]QGQ94317.1 GNAT family N-acetyltransferase [Paenibacillus psychroresistens]
MYYKKLFVIDGTQPIPVVIRNYHENDFAALIEIQRLSFPPPFPDELLWNRDQLSNHVMLFPEGALCLEIEGTIVGSMTALQIDYDPTSSDHSWDEITDNGYIRNHNPLGNALYVVDISILPAYRKLGLGLWLMFAMYQLVIYKNLDRLLGGGRMPGYHKKASELSAEQYLEEVMKGKLVDPVITFLLRCGRTPVKVIANYLEDEQSCDNAVLMEWTNPFKT